MGPRRGVNAYPPRNPLFAPRAPDPRYRRKSPAPGGALSQSDFQRAYQHASINEKVSFRLVLPGKRAHRALLRWQRKRGILRSVKALSMAGSIFERSRFRLLIVRRFALIAEAKAKDAWERKAGAR